MSKQIFIYIDVPQHFRIASALASALDESVEMCLLSTVPVPADFKVSSARIDQMEMPAFGSMPRLLRVLLRGIFLNRKLGIYIRRAAGRTIVVFNDTGIAQRYLIRIGARLGSKTVLVQDGLTETQHRENTDSFKLKRRITAALLEPLGLGHYGTSNYGCAGAAVVLADGPAAGAFFRGRAASATVFETGFLRPGMNAHGLAGQPYILFWAVDFLGGLNNRVLHNLQLKAIEHLSRSLKSRAPDLRIRVRLHPGDILHAHEFTEALGRLVNVDIANPDTEPLAGGKPVAAASLQSAGVLDTLAAYVPSFYLASERGELTPSWAPQEMLVGLDAFSDVATRLYARPDFGNQVWKEQAASLSNRIKIPFDAGMVRAALR